MEFHIKNLENDNVILIKENESILMELKHEVFRAKCNFSFISSMFSMKLLVFFKPSLILGPSINQISEFFSNLVNFYYFTPRFVTNPEFRTNNH